MRAGDFVGAFADAAVLFPLLAALSLKSDFSGTWLLLTAGLAYISAGLLFRVPMSVQPLKAIAIAAVASGASQSEVRLAGALLGVACLAVSLADADALAARVPRALIHGLQLALGVILIGQGIKATGGFTPPPLLFAAVLVLLTARSRVPWLGLVATGGMIYALLAPAPAAQGVKIAGGIRPEMVLLLVLPQVVLTLANSVVGTIDVTHRYFAENAERVTARRLLGSIGIGNLVAACVGGLPFCHGSGGVTAHVKGGARHWGANLVIGVFLLGLAFAGGASSAALPFPPFLLGTLLAATGLFHLQLAGPSWRAGEKARLVAMGLVAALTANMLAVLAVGVIPEIAAWASRQFLLGKRA